MITRRERIAQMVEQRRREVLEWYLNREVSGCGEAIQGSAAGTLSTEPEQGKAGPRDVKGQLKLF